MRNRWLERSVWAALGLSLGVVGSALFAAPWLAPLQDRVVNAMSNVCAAVAAVGGAYLLWQHQTREREARLKASIVTIFEGLHEDLNLARITLTFDGSKTLMEAQGQSTDDPKDIAEYIRYSGRFRLHYVEQRAALAVQQLYSIQDAIAGLSRSDIQVLLELHQAASECVRRVPGFVGELDAAPGNLYLSAASMSVLEHGVSYLAYQLNQLDGGQRDDGLYVHNLASFDAVKKKALSMSPEIRQLGPAPPAAP